MVTLRAWVSCGAPSTSASIAGTTAPRASVASDPAIATSHSTLPSAAANTFAVATASEPCTASSSTCTALSAPIDSALRIDSVARSGPTVRIVTSPPWASLSNRPSSIANSSM